MCIAHACYSRWQQCCALFFCKAKPWHYLCIATACSRYIGFGEPYWIALSAVVPDHCCCSSYDMPWMLSAMPELSSPIIGMCGQSQWQWEITCLLQHSLTHIKPCNGHLHTTSCYSQLREYYSFLRHVTHSYMLRHVTGKWQRVTKLYTMLHTVTCYNTRYSMLLNGTLLLQCNIHVTLPMLHIVTLWGYKFVTFCYACNIAMLRKTDMLQPGLQWCYNVL